MADVIVLAEDASEVTVGQKDGSGTMISDERRFFTKMGEDTGDHQFGPGLAESDSPIQPVNPALPRTEPALFQNFMEGLDSFIQFSRFIKLDIRG